MYTSLSRPKSYSKIGMTIDRQRNPSKQLRKPKNIPIQARSTARNVKPTFETISRQKHSPYTMMMTKDFNRKANYHPNFGSVEPHEPKIEFTHSKIQGFIKQAIKQVPGAQENDLKKDVIMEAKLQHDRRKKMHQYDFSKQSGRKLHSADQNVTNDSEWRFNNFDSTRSSFMKTRSQSVHSFDSYPHRRQLFDVIGAAPAGLINVDDVNLDLVKPRWNPASTVKFDKLAQTIKVRTDRDVTPWVAKLHYDTEKQRSKSTTTLRFDGQASRKPNQVHSRYPLRQCL